MARKSPEAFRTISEVAEILDIPAHVLRFWESKFTQIKPVKRGGGRRFYRPGDIDLLRGLRDLLHGQGMSIKAAQTLLRQEGAKHVAALGHVDLAEAAPQTMLPAEPPLTAQKPSLPKYERPEPQLRIAQPKIDDAAEEEMQLDLFAVVDRRKRRPFPPDPALAARRAEIRTIYSKLKNLRARMAG